MKAPLILVVDDHRLYRESVCKLIRTCLPAAEVIAVADGSEALRLTQQLPVSLIVLDYQLQTMSGGDIVRLLNSRAASSGCAAPPIVLMSSQPDVAVFARSLGVAGFLHKPMSIDDIDALIAPLVLSSGSREQSSAWRPWRIGTRTA